MKKSFRLALFLRNHASEPCFLTQQRPRQVKSGNWNPWGKARKIKQDVYHSKLARAPRNDSQYNLQKLAEAVSPVLSCLLSSLTGYRMLREAAATPAIPWTREVGVPLEQWIHIDGSSVPENIREGMKPDWHVACKEEVGPALPCWGEENKARKPQFACQQGLPALLG